MKVRRAGRVCAAALLASCAFLALGCGSNTNVNPAGDAGGKSGDGAFAGNDGGALDATLGANDGQATDAGASGADASGTSAPANCPGPDLRCHVDTCSGPGTSVSGTVYDPAGKNPIPHAYVFVPTDPNGTIPPITPGALTCDTCDLPIGSYVVATTSDATGSFSLTGVPTGTHVPIVVQIGKWRREVFVTTTSCQNTVLAAADTHLPASQADGDMPAMALLTGGLDDLGCLLVRFGIAPGEYKAPHSGGRVDVYQGLSITGNGPALSNGDAGNCTNTSCPLWADKASLESYDIVLLACEGETYDETVDAGGGLATAGPNITAAGKQAMHDWLDEGGKVFATHYHYTWFMNGPSDFQGTASWKGYSIATGTGNEAIATTFPKAQDLVTALADAGTDGMIQLSGVADSVGAVTAPTLAWIKDPTTSDTKYLTFTTPVGRTCGKAAFSDLHVAGAPTGDIPLACMPRALTNQERAMELLFFDLSACVSDDSKAPPGPPPSN